ncbi:MAG: pyruvate, phosphate dikinase, partial [Bacteroidales bacterium]|nr:pyruvate, phosphate dikinase [Bacteroidales bacterium]
EYALDLNKAANEKPSFYLLQIKPMHGSGTGFSFDKEQLRQEDLVIYAEQSMGNGKITGVRDAVFVKLEAFDRLRTKEIAAELEKMNREMKEAKREYILIGPGRWGTADPHIGIPVKWSHISNARIIIETSMEDFPLDASLGSHFFHNVTSMNVGYFSIQHNSPSEFIRWDMLQQQKVVEESEFLKHVRFEKPLSILMDGKKRISAVMQEGCDGPVNRDEDAEEQLL